MTYLLKLQSPWARIHFKPIRITTVDNGYFYIVETSINKKSDVDTIAAYH